MHLSYVSLVTPHLDELKDFYARALGLVELVEWSHDGFRALAAGADLVLAFHSPEAYADMGLVPPGPGSSLLTFDPGDVANLKRIHDELNNQGVPVLRELFETPYGSVQVIHEDPDGNPFRLNTFYPPSHQ